jgi:hypothetical protein
VDGENDAIDPKRSRGALAQRASTATIHKAACLGALDVKRPPTGHVSGAVYSWTNHWEDGMPTFITYVSYTQEAVKGMVSKPSDRTPGIRGLIRGG